MRIERAAGPLADDQVELKILHSRVEDLLHGGPADVISSINTESALQVGSAGAAWSRPR
jgi:hypothetical protein